jgi:hypothetical protein
MLYSCLLWCCKCVIGTPQQKHLEIIYAPLVARDTISQQHVYKLCISIDLVNDNQYQTVLINNVTGECSTDPVPQAHLIWSNKNTTPVMELQNFLQITSWTYKVPLWRFKTYSALVQTSAAICSASSMVRAPLHPKMKFGPIHKISTSPLSHNKKTNLYCIIFCSKLQISKEHVKKHANEVPKHRSNDCFVYSDKYTHHDQVFCSRSWYSCMQWMQHPPKYRSYDLSNVARSTNFAKLQVASLVNHLAKLFERNQLAWCTKYVTYWWATLTNYQ